MLLFFIRWQQTSGKNQSTFAKAPSWPSATIGSALHVLGNELRIRKLNIRWVFSSSQHECEIICRWFLQLKNLYDNQKTTDETSVGIVICNNLGQTQCDKNFTTFMKETEKLARGKMLYINGIFFNRFSRNGVYFVSPWYSRSKSAGISNNFVRYKKMAYNALDRLNFSYLYRTNGLLVFVFAHIVGLKLDLEIGPLKGYFDTLTKTDNDFPVSIDQLRKVFAFVISESEFRLIMLGSAFDHSYLFFSIDHLNTVFVLV